MIRKSFMLETSIFPNATKHLHAQIPILSGGVGSRGKFWQLKPINCNCLFIHVYMQYVYNNMLFPVYGSLKVSCEILLFEKLLPLSFYRSINISKTFLESVFMNELLICII